MLVKKAAVFPLVLTGLSVMCSVTLANAAERKADEAALKQQTAAFVEALMGGDAKEVAGFWTAEGEYASGDGVSIRGISDLEQAYREHFEQFGSPKVTHEIDTIRFLSRDTAVVEGTFESIYAKKQEANMAGFSALYVREDGRWGIAVLREWTRRLVLRDLGWLVGKWSASTEGGDVYTAYHWNDDKTLITMNFSVKTEEGTVTGHQVIARDPATGAIRSWVFQGGGIGEAYWSREGKKWVISSTGLSADGQEMTATNIYTPEGQDTFTYESVNRTLDEEQLPDIGPITVKRVK